MKPFGLTGNMGCGKSTVAQMLSELPDVVIFDGDLVAKQLLADLHYRAMIIAIVGSDCFDNDRPNSQRISKVIFTDLEKKRKLEALLHPLVWQTTQEQMTAMGEDKLYILESAIIYETGSQDRFSAIIVVKCSEEEQMLRLQINRGMNRQDIQVRLQQQLSASEKEKRADIVIDTNCHFDELYQRVQNLYGQLRQLKQTNPNKGGPS